MRVGELISCGSERFTDLESPKITPSRGLDFGRCQLLCQTIDRFVGGSFRHIVVVDRSDYQLFKPLRNSVRDVIEIESLLPSWIRPTNFVFGRFRRRIWIGWRCRPIHGWFAQQLAHRRVCRFRRFLRAAVRPFSHHERLQSSPRARARSHRRGQNSPSRLVRNRRTSAQSLTTDIPRTRLCWKRHHLDASKRGCDVQAN